MKYLVVSDIHGSLLRLQQVLAFYEKEHYDMLLILGDILNYGPRNGVPEGLDAPGIVAALNPLADRIVAVRGNCDAEVDQMLLKFPLMGDYALVVIGDKRVFLTHGHNFGPDNQSPGYDIYFCGHSHLWQLDRQGEKIVCNTGSITFPKGGNLPTFATIDEDGFIRMRRLDGSIMKELKI